MVGNCLCFYSLPLSPFFILFLSVEYWNCQWVKVWWKTGGELSWIVIGTQREAGYFSLVQELIFVFFKWNSFLIFQQFIQHFYKETNKPMVVNYWNRIIRTKKKKKKKRGRGKKIPKRLTMKPYLSDVNFTKWNV